MLRFHCDSVLIEEKERRKRRKKKKGFSLAKQRVEISKHSFVRPKYEGRFYVFNS